MLPTIWLKLIAYEKAPIGDVSAVWQPLIGRVLNFSSSITIGGLKGYPNSLSSLTLALPIFGDVGYDLAFYFKSLTLLFGWSYPLDANYFYTYSRHWFISTTIFFIYLPLFLLSSSSLYYRRISIASSCLLIDSFELKYFLFKWTSNDNFLPCYVKRVTSLKLLIEGISMHYWNCLSIF